MAKPGDAIREFANLKRRRLLEGGPLQVRFTPRIQNVMDGYTIQIGVLHRKTRMSWKTLRHKDGTKPIMVFPKSEQARRHAKKHARWGEMVRIVAPDGTVEGPL